MGCQSIKEKIESQMLSLKLERVLIRQEKKKIIKQYEDYVGFDPLKVWITEAHKRGIKVHIWFQTFYVPSFLNSHYVLAP